MENTTNLQDWQLGNNSTTSPIKRVELMNEWLKRNKQEILASRLKETTETEYEPIGFIDKLNQWG